MSLFNGFFSNTKHSAAYTKLHRVLRQTRPHIRMHTAYYLFCFTRSIENIEHIKSAIYNADALEKLRKQSEYDPHYDTIDLYFVLDEKKNSYFVFVLDPREITKSQKLLEVIAFNRRISFYGKRL